MVGLTKPTVDIPFKILTSLTRVSREAKVGLEADVPPIKVGAPSLNMTTVDTRSMVSRLLFDQSEDLTYYCPQQQRHQGILFHYGCKYLRSHRRFHY